MIIDLESIDSGTVLSADLCIIGAGAAGIAIAREFINSSLDVCLLESGGDSFETETQNLYRAKNVGIPRNPHNESRLRFFGGTTNHWSGHCAPFAEEDFQKREWIPHSGWPIERADLLPFYSRAYQVCELDPLPFETDWTKHTGRNVPGLDTDRLQHYFLQFSPPTRFGPAYRAELKRASNIRVLMHANVSSIVPTRDATAIDRVRVRSIGGHTAEVRANKVVLCCGGIENARMMLLSNEVVKAGLGNQHDVVGRYFMDHPFGKIGLVQKLGNAPIQDYFGSHHFGERRFKYGLALSSQTQRRKNVLGCGIQFWPNNEIPPGFLLEGSDSYIDNAIIEFNRQWHGLKRKLWNSASQDNYEFYDLMAVAEQAPDPLSRVSLAIDRDQLGLNQARIDWRLSSLDRRTREIAVQEVAREFGRLGLGRIRVLDWLRDNMDWAGNIEDYNHHMGTTRMSDDPKFGVVDRNCRVHDLANFYIAGSSVFPTSGVANPTLTIVALALRLSDHLKHAMPR